MPPRRPRALAAIAGALLLVGAGAGAIVALSSGSAPPLSTRVCRGGILAHDGQRAASPVAQAQSAPLDLKLSRDGSIEGIRVGDRDLPTLPSGGGFSIRRAGGGRNLLPNGSFARDANGDGVPDGWTFTASGTGSSPRLVTDPSHLSSGSIQVSNPVKESSGTFRADVAVEPDTFYVFSAWFRSRDVRPIFPTAIRETYHPHSPLKVDVQQLVGGNVVATASAWGYTGTADWNRQFVGLRTRRDVTALRLVGWMENGSGTGWFDDLSLSRLFPENAVRLHGVTSPASGGGTTQRATVPGGGLSVEARFRPARDHVRVDGVVRGNGEADQGFQLTYTLPVDARGWQWADNPRGSRAIGAGAYAYLSTSSLQQSSRYPWGVIADTRSALAMGVPLDRPRLFRIGYDASAGLSITFDLGVSPAAAALGDRATFSFVVYTADPVWGFRSATQRYYDLFPDQFRRRMNPACEGGWFVAPPIDSIGRTYLDFGLGLDMVALGKSSSQSQATWGTRYLRWDNVRHIATTAYTHQWAFYDRVGGGAELSYEQAISRLQAEARGPAANDAQRRLRDDAAGALASTERDYNGRLYYERFGDRYAYYQNVDAVPSAPVDWPRAADSQQVQRALKLAARFGRLDGIHLDSTSGMRRWGAADDYDRRHWAAASIPLTFSYDSGLVAVRGIFPMYDRISDLAASVRRQGMILTANFNAAETQTLGFLGADRIDYFGLEQGLTDRARPGMSSDQFAMLKRTLAYQRPVSTLDHRIGQGKLRPEEIERRLQQNLFYGMFSGAFDAETEADARGNAVTWSTPQNARIWARYAPLIKEVAVAGWEPVTFAWSSNPRVWLERFGSLASGDLHLTVRNETAAPQRFSLTIDIRSLRADPSKSLTAVEEITGVTFRITSNPSAGVAVLTLTVPARSTRLLAVSESA